MPIISETEIALISNNYTHLKCKIFDKNTNELLSSQLINNCIPTPFTINRKPNDFNIILYNQANMVIEDFQFDEKQFKITKVNDKNFYDGQGHSSKIISKSISRKHLNIFSSELDDDDQEQIIRVKKQADSCSIYLTVFRTKFRAENIQITRAQMNENDRLRAIAVSAYKKIEQKAFKILQRRRQNLRKFSIKFQDIERKNKNINKSMNSTINGYAPKSLNQIEMKKFLSSLKKNFSQKQKINQQEHMKGGIWGKIDNQFTNMLKKVQKQNNWAIRSKKHSRLKYAKVKLISESSVPGEREDIDNIGRQMINTEGFIQKDQPKCFYRQFTNSNIVQKLSNSHQNSLKQSLKRCNKRQSNMKMISHRRNFSYDKWNNKIKTSQNNFRMRNTQSLRFNLQNVKTFR